jgi:hypothetical protein
MLLLSVSLASIKLEEPFVQPDRKLALGSSPRKGRVGGG